MSQERPSSFYGDQPARGRPRLHQLMTVLAHVVELQYRIILLRAKLTVLRIAVLLALATATAVLSILAIIFIAIGLFHLLLMYLSPAWAYLLCGGLNAAVAVILALVARHMLLRSDDAAPAKDREPLKRTSDSDVDPPVKASA